ncbi:MAG TPA: hypothetical protein VFD76_02305 [Gemmatimonadales bacterium]|nr:hypothetical protein [Gemmatimonadales bacterium]
MLLTAYPANRLAAQVGHDPGHSPYHDIPKGAAWVATFGYLSGSRGSVDVGPSDGMTAGLRYEVPLGAIGASLGVAYARTTSFVMDASTTTDSLSRRSGPYDDGVVLVDAGLQLALAGRKSWRGLAPYIGGALGVAVGQPIAKDSSGYKFGTKITLAPNAGFRWYPARRLSLRGDFRLELWKLSYPLSYKQQNFQGSRILNVNASLSEWTAHPWGTIGLGWIF